MLNRMVVFFLNLKPVKAALLRMTYFGKGIKIKSSLVGYHTSILHDTQIMEGTATDSHTFVGKYCYIGRFCYITKAVIGNYCSIANNVSIGQGEHALDKISTSSFFYNNSYEELTKKDCVIGNDVWIGVDAIILRGVTVGDGAVIGANSVVTKDVPPFAIVVGSPARVVRFRFPEKRIEEIIRSDWWSLNLDEAKEAIGKLDG